jgi:LEA14-like dessication related protein
MKPVSKVICALVIIMVISIALPVNAQVLEKDANPVRLVLTQWGGVSLEQQGQERFLD